jgi:predicted nucleic acid-binding protein
MTKVVINTSPLIVLFKSHLAYILPQLFTEIVVPEAVWHEIVEVNKTDLAARQLPQVSWVKRVNLTHISPVITAWGLDPGESEVLSFAWFNSDYRTILDDAAARRVARTLNLPLIGTIGLIILAKQRSLIPSISDALQSLKDSGLWISEDLVKFALQQTGEEEN